MKPTTIVRCLCAYIVLLSTTRALSLAADGHEIKAVVAGLSALCFLIVALLYRGPVDR